MRDARGKRPDVSKARDKPRRVRYAPLAQIAAIGCLVTGLSACGAGNPRQPDFYSARTLPPLVVPSDLLGTTGAAAKQSAAPPTAQETSKTAEPPVRPTPASETWVSIRQRPDGVSILTAESGFDYLWPEIGKALTAIGVAVKNAHPPLLRGKEVLTGIYHVTDSQPDVGRDRGFFKRLLKRKSAENNFRIHVESSGGLSEVTVQDEGGRADNSEGAQRLLTRLYEKLLTVTPPERPGITASQAPSGAVAAAVLQPSPEPASQQKVLLQRNSNGVQALTVRGGFKTVWTEIGQSLHAIGAAVSATHTPVFGGSDPQVGVYRIQYADPETKGTEKEDGIARWFRRKSGDRYQVRIESRGNSSEITIRTERGKPDNSETGRRLLGLLSERLQ